MRESDIEIGDCLRKTENGQFVEWHRTIANRNWNGSRSSESRKIMTCTGEQFVGMDLRIIARQALLGAFTDHHRAVRPLADVDALLFFINRWRVENRDGRKKRRTWVCPYNHTWTFLLRNVESHLRCYLCGRHASSEDNDITYEVSLGRPNVGDCTSGSAILLHETIRDLSIGIDRPSGCLHMLKTGMDDFYRLTSSFIRTKSCCHTCVGLNRRFKLVEFLCTKKPAVIATLLLLADSSVEYRSFFLGFCPAELSAPTQSNVSLQKALEMWPPV